MLLVDDDEAEVLGTAGRAPSARPPRALAPPVAAMRQQRRRSAWVTPECHSAGRAPKRASTREMNSPVRAISGRSTSAWRPLARHSATASR